VKSLGQELLNDRHVVEQCRLGQTAFVGQIMPELADYFGPGGDLDCLPLFHNARLAKHEQQSTQCFPIASADPMLPASKLQEPIHDRVVQIEQCKTFLFKPSAEIGDYDDLLSDRVVSIALLGNTGCISVEILT